LTKRAVIISLLRPPRTGRWVYRVSGIALAFSPNLLSL